VNRGVREPRVAIERALEATDELVDALARLVPQLSDRAAPTREHVAAVVADERTSLLVARDDDGRIVGTLTLVTFRIPSGRVGRIEDVVVDAPARGQGIGEALTREAQRLAAAAGVDALALLYLRLGFERRETNVYAWRPR
jgi:ribosomal protein S18 acetylase RimI-like enzyme